MTLTSVYWWYPWNLCTGEDSDICVLDGCWLWYLTTGDDSDNCVKVMTLISVYWSWIWHLCKVLTLISVFWRWLWLQCIVDNPGICVLVLIMISDICLLVMTLTSGYWWSFWEPCTGNDSDICMLVMTLTYWYWCLLSSVYCWWLWYLSTNIPLISVYWWWLGHLYTADDSDICPLVMILITVYWRWLWHLCTSHEEKKIHTDSRTDDKQQPTGAHKKVCLRFQLSRAKVFYGKKFVFVFRILLILWFQRSKLSALSRRLSCVRELQDSLKWDEYKRLMDLSGSQISQVKPIPS